MCRKNLLLIVGFDAQRWRNLTRAFSKAFIR